MRNHPHTRRSFLQRAGGGLGLAALAHNGRAANASSPNVLFLVCDDLNDSIAGMGGHPQARTPNINRLMESGVQFTNAQSNCPLCAPSRASLWSGLYPGHMFKHRLGLNRFLSPADICIRR